MEKIHEKTLNRTRNYTKILCLFVFFFVLFGVEEAQAASASLYLSPSSGTYNIGNTFSVVVKLNSGGDTINAAEGTLIFNPVEISVESISKSDSIFSLWTTEPTFSNFEGDIVFGGGTPKNFTGISGTIVNITFKAKTNASAQVSFSSGSILAADGKGTNILANMTGGVYILQPKISVPPASPAPPAAEAPQAEYVPPTPGAVPALPVVSSSTHPNPDKWYSNNDPEFSWNLPSDATGTSLLLHKSPTANPGQISDGLIESKKYEDIEDGIWYFHIRFKNQSGWGGILHRKVLIDTEPPKTFEIKVDNGGDSTNPSPILHFETTDSISGIEYYEVKIGEGNAVPIMAAALKNNPYKLSPQAPGKHTVIVKAVDAASNSIFATSDVTIKPIEAPVITDFPTTVRTGDALTIKGTSFYPDATVTIFVKKEGEEASKTDIKTDKEGNWFFLYEKSLDKGTYQIWAEITDNRGAKSKQTEKITLAATLPPIVKFGKIAIDYLTVIITLISLIVFLILVIFYSCYRISVWRKRIRKETTEVEKSVIRAFRALREEVEEQIEYLDRKPGLTKKEKEIRDKLQEALNVSEEFISKEIRDIEKELE